ncbi:probable aldo-keto reductase 1 [Carica papaya]|uniref:probable aldo-keto reductase 1 n=1 Tax=Carica papaya TaxID=3649 RepID=UPI000B8CEDC8|nr:probable aldo-keto reductase 1 [Carica papaya]XP_021891257.1 probable aldo-keto reductase 1 [Carica papaya]XP_021891258.1 probable aldo-keto reductase 1 [Carica papaya]
MAEEDKKAQIPKVKLGNQGLEVSKLGFGCMRLSGIKSMFPGQPGYATVSDDDGIMVIKEAFNMGITFFDTADIYGPHTNEILLGKALKQLPREKIQVATKFGFVSGITVRGDPEYVRVSCEASLQRLGVDYIDLYYQHRVDTSIPIEETMSELKKLVEEGKIKYVGLSEASPDTIRRAHAVHPITAVQMEWSLWSRDIEEEIVPLCRELGIGIVPYCPLGRGFFAGVGVDSPATGLLASHPRFQKENLEKNKSIYIRIQELAKNHECSPSQLALAWLLHQRDDVVPIFGTTKLKNMEENIVSVRIKLTEDEQKEISDAVPLHEVAGGRSYASVDRLSWKFANTPPKGSVSST